MPPAVLPPDWPHSDLSRQIETRAHLWHVQETGRGPTVLLLHGAGGSTHSWRDLIPLLAQKCRVVAVDLPGHGFTRLGTRHRSGLGTMAEDIATLCAQEGWEPACIVGHSAGAAIALRLAPLLPGNPRIVGINPALSPFRGLAGFMFPVFARVIAMTPMMVDVAVRAAASPGRVVSLIGGTGSELSAKGMDLYAQLFRRRDHVDGTLLMMSQWKLDGLLADLPQLRSPCLFLTGSNDRTVPPVTAVEAADRMPDARVESFEGLGHLMHEEAPDKVARRILDWIGQG
ncbi:alpha/beta fold hydrolase BchO [Aestuariicoccus sp. MJ-SS9]|uniref:alpha/beta fold hydrolase BchO n=1 Tax=Aestuariicoccus sp. MJ-SS9 TaxID=3079855 RepID=UPI0029118D7A|nr:alpha/beta fold hydrolase BchO [Aestuariicoccus sp. MJ-SS9]MDU8910925.1 alpha/beta fold hydrolase [Aestuariicoccus sp. MJ-SS9]